MTNLLIVAAILVALALGALLSASVRLAMREPFLVAAALWRRALTGYRKDRSLADKQLQLNEVVASSLWTVTVGVSFSNGEAEANDIRVTEQLIELKKRTPVTRGTALGS